MIFSILWINFFFHFGKTQLLFPCDSRHILKFCLPPDYSVALRFLDIYRAECSFLLIYMSVQNIPVIFRLTDPDGRRMLKDCPD